jgi:hypothetical protein
MSVERRLSSRTRVGVAIASGELVARAAPSLLAGGELRRALGGEPSADGRWTELEDALAELRSSLPPSMKISVSIALLPPLVQIRCIGLPPLRPDERRRVLTRDAGRYFVGAREPFVADAVPVAGANGDVIAAALPARYAEAVARAATAVGMSVRTMQPAPWAWVASLESGRRQAARALVVRGGGARSSDVVWLARGEVTEVRRVRAGDATSELETLLEREASSGASVEIGDATGLAAAFADRARGPELLPEWARAERRAEISRRARALAIGAAAMLLMAAGIELFGVRHQLATVRAERTALHPRVMQAMASRDSAAALETQLGAVAVEVSGAPRWTGVIANLTRMLPLDAWLTSITASGDSVSLVGEAARAADVFDALRRDSSIAGIRADAPIRREVTADRTPIERFSVTVRLTRAALTTMPVAEHDGSPREEP